MVYASAKDNRLSRGSKDLVRLLDPLLHDIPGDLYPALGGFLVCPLATDLAGTRHVDLFGNEDTQGNQHALVYQLLRRDRGDHPVIDLPQPLRKGRGRQADHPDLWVVPDELDSLLSGLMALVHDQ